MTQPFDVQLFRIFVELLELTDERVVSFLTLDVEVAVDLVRNLEDLSHPEECEGDEYNELKNAVEGCEVHKSDTAAKNYCRYAVEGVDRARSRRNRQSARDSLTHLFGVLDIVMDLVRDDKDFSHPEEYHGDNYHPLINLGDVSEGDEGDGGWYAG